jgi:hypothetical protein
MESSAARQAIVSEMTGMLQRDAPWVWGFYPKDFGLAHQWVYNRKPNKMANNTLKYQRLDPALRERLRDEWNPPVRWPLALLALVLVLVLLPAFALYRKRERAGALLPAGPRSATPRERDEAVRWSSI